MGIRLFERDYSTHQRESRSLKGTILRAKGNLALRKGLFCMRKGIRLFERDYSTRQRESRSLKGALIQNPNKKKKPPSGDFSIL